MIYLIGGPPRVGKSTLASLLAKASGIPHISADDIASVIVPYIPEHEYPDKLPIRIVREETNYSNDVCYAKYSAEEIVGFYIRQAETLWPGFKSFINYALADNHDFIVEGWQILPHLVATVANVQNKEQIRMCFLYKRDSNNIVKVLMSSKSKNDWVIRNTRDAATFVAIAKMISHFGELIRIDAAKHDFEAVDMDLEFNQNIKKLSESL